MRTELKIIVKGKDNYINKIIMKKYTSINKKTIFLISTLLLCVWLSYTCCLADENEEIIISVQLDGETVYGTYNGELLNESIPNGKGTFQTLDSEELSFTLEGNWNEGTLSDAAIITFEDGAILEGSFRDGLMQGKAKFTSSDGVYNTIPYNKGIANASSVFYSKEGKLIDVDYYYYSKRVSILCQNSVELEYIDVLKYPSNYMYVPVHISGTVIQIMDTKNEEILEIMDNDGNIYYCNYSNNGVSRPQALMPNFNIDDNVTIYGYLNDCVEFEFENWGKRILAEKIPENIKMKDIETYFDQNSSSESLKNYFKSRGTAPYINVFFGEFSDENFDLNILDTSTYKEYDYEYINRYPYYFLNMKYQTTVDVISITMNYEKDNASMVLLEDGNKYLYATISYSDNKSIPTVGQKITISGLLKGNAKIELDDQLYIICPKVLVSSFN